MVRLSCSGLDVWRITNSRNGGLLVFFGVLPYPMGVKRGSHHSTTGVSRSISYKRACSEVEAEGARFMLPPHMVRWCGLGWEETTNCNFEVTIAYAGRGHIRTSIEEQISGSIITIGGRPEVTDLPLKAPARCYGANPQARIDAEKLISAPNPIGWVASY